MSSRKTHKKQLFNEDKNQAFQHLLSFGERNSEQQSKKSGTKSAYSRSNSSMKKHQESIGLKNKLIDFLLKAAEIERKLQIIKQTLCEEESFTPASLFHRMDRDRKGYLLQKDIQHFLMDNKTQFKGSELKILFGKINVDQQDSGVMLWEFQNFILPNQNPRLRYLCMRRPVFIPLQDEKLQPKLEWLMSKFFAEIMKQEAKLKEINATLISSYDFRPQTVFQLLADIDGFITGQSLSDFMFNEGFEVSVEQIGCILKLIDKQGEGRICLKDFKYFLATLGLKKEHQIFDELSPIPALKNFVIPLIESINNRQQTLKQRIADNKMHRSSKEKRGLSSSGKIKRSRVP